MPTLPEETEPVTPAEVLAERTRRTVVRAIGVAPGLSARLIVLLAVALAATASTGTPLGVAGSVAVLLIGLDSARSRK